jgi:hypothetical protein
MVGKSQFSPHEKAEVVTYAKWKKRYINGGLEAMKPGYKSEIDDIEKETLKLKTIVGELYVELDYLKKKLGMEK